VGAFLDEIRAWGEFCVWGVTRTVPVIAVALQKAMQNMECRSQISNFRSQISDLRSQISDLKFQISNFRSQISNFKVQGAK
jgi:cell division protein FtsL